MAHGNMPTERRQSHKSTYCIILFILISRIGKYLETPNRCKVACGGRMRGKQKRGMPAGVYGVSSWDTNFRTKSPKISLW